MSRKPRHTPHLAPLNFIKTTDGQVKLILAPGVQWAIDSKERARRFNAKPVKAFFARYRKVGGDPQRLKPLLEGLLPVEPPRPPTQKVLKPMVRRASEALNDLLELPGNLPGHKTRKVFEEAADLLCRFDDHAQEGYLAQFTSHTPSQYAVTIPVTIVGSKWLPSQDQESSTCLVLSYPQDKDRPFQTPLVPPIGAPGRGRIQRGSQAGFVIGVLAKECRRRFEAPWWPDILRVCCALAPETFDTKCETVERLRKRVERVPKDHIAVLFRQLLPTD